MPLNPSIALSAAPVQFPDPLANYARVMQIQQAQNQNALAQYQLAAAQREGEIKNQLLALNPSDPDYINQVKRVNPALGSELELRATQQAREERMGREAQAKAFHSNIQSFQAMSRDASLNPTDDAIKALGKRAVDLGINSMQDATAHTTHLLGLPMEQRTALLQQVGSAPPPWQRSTLLTPAEEAQRIRIAQASHPPKESAALDPNENAAISKAIVEGRLDPNRVNGRNAKTLAATLLANPDANLLELGVSAAGATAGERALAAQTARMSTAANEANKMASVVRDLSVKVDRTQFPTVNAIQNAVDKGTGGTEIVKLNTAINALVNSYARAISPTGAPTVSDKNHAREIIHASYANGQIQAILDVMQQEMSIARSAAGTASTELKAARETGRGRSPTPTPAASAAAGASSVTLPDGRTINFPSAAAAAAFRKDAGL